MASFKISQLEKVGIDTSIYQTRKGNEESIKKAMNTVCNEENNDH